MAEADDAPPARFTLRRSISDDDKADHTGAAGVADAVVAEVAGVAGVAGVTGGPTPGWNMAEGGANEGKDPTDAAKVRPRGKDERAGRECMDGAPTADMDRPRP